MPSSTELHYTYRAARVRAYRPIVILQQLPSLLPYLPIRTCLLIRTPYVPTVIVVVTIHTLLCRLSLIDRALSRLAALSCLLLIGALLVSPVRYFYYLLRCVPRSLPLFSLL